MAEAKLAAEAEAKAANRFKSRVVDESSIENSNEQQSESAATIAISKARLGSALFLSSHELANGSIDEEETEKTHEVRASLEHLMHDKDHRPIAIDNSEENNGEEYKAMLPQIDEQEGEAGGYPMTATGRNQTPINALNKTGGSFDQDFEGMMKMEQSKSMVEIPPAEKVGFEPHEADDNMKD